MEGADIAQPGQPESHPVNTSIASCESPSWGNTKDAGSLSGTAGLAIILGQVVTYFGGRVDADDMDVFSFSLHHLFARVDFLYRQALPALLHSTLAMVGGQAEETNASQCISVGSIVLSSPWLEPVANSQAHTATYGSTLSSPERCRRVHSGCHWHDQCQF